MHWSCFCKVTAAAPNIFHSILFCTASYLLDLFFPCDIHICCPSFYFECKTLLCPSNNHIGVPNLVQTRHFINHLRDFSFQPPNAPYHSSQSAKPLPPPLDVSHVVGISIGHDDQEDIISPTPAIFYLFRLLLSHPSKIPGSFTRFSFSTCWIMT